MDTIKIELTENEAQLFVLFQKHHAIIQVLETCGFFDMKNGSVEIHKDYDGNVKVAKVHKNLNF